MTEEEINHYILWLMEKIVHEVKTNNTASRPWSVWRHDADTVDRMVQNYIARLRISLTMQPEERLQTEARRWLQWDEFYTRVTAGVKAAREQKARKLPVSKKVSTELGENIAEVVRFRPNKPWEAEERFKSVSASNSLLEEKDKQNNHFREWIVKLTHMEPSSALNEFIVNNERYNSPVPELDFQSDFWVDVDLP